MNVSDALKELAGPRGPSELKRAIERAARLSGLTYWRCFDIWYGKARRIEPHEVSAITDALQAKRENDAANELHDLKIRLARLESRLAQTDADFHRPLLDAPGLSLRGAR